LEEIETSHIPARESETEAEAGDKTKEGSKRQSFREAPKQVSKPGKKRAERS
jgi:hypothetical protein